MSTEPRYFNPNFYYHVYNCGIEKRDVFLTASDYHRFLKTADYYLHFQRLAFSQFSQLNDEARQVYASLNPKGLETLRVRVISYCLMPNHFHLVLKPEKENGASLFLADLANSYTRYFNVKNERIGALFQGPFKAKEITTEESLLQVTRYIHLNPVSSAKTNPFDTLNAEDYPYSSYREWLGLDNLNPKGLNITNGKEIHKWLGAAGGQSVYRVFVEAKIGQKPEIGIEDLIIE
ncbi:MAG: transposase [bacterium]|nr:transposase [bacterium]